MSTWPADFRSGFLFQLACLWATTLTFAVAAEPIAGQLPPSLKIQQLLPADPNAKIDWATLRGNVVVLEFWASWCGPCVQAMPHLNELAENYKNAPVRFIAITDEPESVVNSFLSKHPVAVPIALDDNSASFAAFGVKHIPTTIVIDRNGLVAAVTEPGLLRADQIDALIAGRSIALPRITPGPVANDHPGELPGGSNPDAPPLFQFIFRKASHRFESEASDGHGTWTLASTQPQKLFAHAYETTWPHIVEEVSLPKDYYDLAVKAPGLSQFEVMPMLIPVLDSTFHVKSERQSREMDSYAMTRADPTAVGLQTASNRPPPQKPPTVVTEMRWERAPIGLLISLLEYKLGRPIVDESGLTGVYDFDVTWDPNNPDESAAIIQAVRDQLGLQLAPAKCKVDVVVIGKP